MDNEHLRKFKLKNCFSQIANLVFNSKLYSFISKSKLIVLNLSYLSLLYEYLTEIAKGLEVNQTITHLKIENISVISYFLQKKMIIWKLKHFYKFYQL